MKGQPHRGCAEVPATDWAPGLAPAQLPGPGLHVGGSPEGTSVALPLP